MPSLVVVGAQWGDEGKGKLVDYLTSRADLVTRFQGGNNAGHTLIVDGVETKLHLVPSGILREHTRCCIGAGCVIDPEVFQGEVQRLKDAGVDVTPARLSVDRDAHLILPYHCTLDQAREVARGKDKIGTTGRGIGPAYEDRARRSGVRVAELLEIDNLLERLEPVVAHCNIYLKEVLGSDQQVSMGEVEKVVRLADSVITPFIDNVSLRVHRALKAEQKVVFEGAQGTLLDQVHGTVPFVTSANTIAGAATTGCGIGPKAIDYVLGVSKAYCTRVGAGPFPTELEGALGDDLREKGSEFGTTTGRPRRCGWFDAVAMRRAVRLNGIDSIALTKLDVLSGFEKIKVCINYLLDGVEVEDVPSLASQLERVEPQYIELDGWEEDLGAAQRWHHLPPAARLYLSTISEIIACPVSIVSVGPERSSTIFSSGANFAKNFVSL